MCAAELRDRVIAVAEEDALVEPGGALALVSVPATARRGQIGRELVEEQPPQRPLIARVARKQSPLDGLGQIDQREHGPVQVREVGCQPLALVLGEALDRILHGRVIVASRNGGAPCAYAAGPGVSSAPSARAQDTPAPTFGRA